MSACRVSEPRSDADGFKLLESVKVVATVDLARSSWRLIQGKHDQGLAHLPILRQNHGEKVRSRAHPPLWIFALARRLNDFASDDNSSPSDTPNTVKMPSNRLTYVRSGDMLYTAILTY